MRGRRCESCGGDGVPHVMRSGDALDGSVMTLCPGCASRMEQRSDDPTWDTRLERMTGEEILVLEVMDR